MDASYLKYLIDEEIYIIKEVDRNKTIGSKPVKETETEQNPLYDNATVIFLEYPEKQSLPEVYQNFLSKILGSVELDPTKVKMIFSEDLKNIAEDDFENCKVIAFLSQDQDNLSSLFNSPRYKVKTLKKNKFLLCDSLDLINNETVLKRKLWEQLKMLFGVT